MYAEGIEIKVPVCGCVNDTILRRVFVIDNIIEFNLFESCKGVEVHNFLGLQNIPDKMANVPSFERCLAPFSPHFQEFSPFSWACFFH